jgi:PAS domain S-box-containing protein
MDFFKTKDNMKKNILLFLRFILILVTILVMTYSKKGLDISEPGYFIAMIYFLSNLVLYKIPAKYFSKSLLPFAMFSFDIIAISLAIYFAQGIHSDFYLIYFLVIFVASVGQDIAGSLPIAIVASIVYGWLLYKSNPGISFFDSKILIRIPFLFILSLMSSYWSQTTRRELKKKDELERFNKQLQKEVTRVIAEEIELRKYSEKIINSVTSGVIAVSSGGIITTLNPEAERSLGIKKEEIVGKDIKSVAGLENVWEKMEHCIQNKTSITRDELTVRTKKMEKIPLGFSISSITGSRDRFSGCVMIFKNLSEIRQLENKLKRTERLSYLGKMASWVAHEIRNPLTAIDGFAQLLRNTSDIDKIKLFTKEIHKGTQRINYIIDDILAFARAKRKIAYVSIDIKNMLESITKGITDIKVTLKSRGSPSIEGDIESIRRLFINLINNSVEAMSDNGELRIEIVDDNDSVGVEIADNGAGIPNEDIKNIFEPFFTTKQRGTGLGLSIVKKIVDEHKGTIRISGERDVGTTVIVMLPKQQKGV